MGRWLLLFSAAALCSASLSADSASSRGGLLFSEWRGDEGGAATGSFVVRSEGGSAFSAAADGISRELRAVAQDVPLRELGLDALFGKQTTDIADWSRNKAEKAGWRLANSWGRDFVFAATEGARLRGLIRSADFGLESDLGGRRANVHIDVLGALRETDGDAVAWQMRAYAGKDAGGNAGLIYRRIVNENARALRDSVFGETLLGLNAFLDYEKHKDGGGFWRWSAGGEFRTAWVDGFGNLYRGITDARHRVKDGRKLASYTSDGYDLRVAVHAPEHPWLIASATYFSFDGEFGQKDETGWRGGLTYRPRNLPLEVAVEYEDSELHGAELGGRIAYKHHFGGVRSLSRSSGGDGFDPRDYFFARASREYTQRIRTADRGPAITSIWSGPGAGLIELTPANNANVYVVIEGGGQTMTVRDASASQPFPLDGSQFNGASVVNVEVVGTNAKATFVYVNPNTAPPTEGTIVIGSTVMISLNAPYIYLDDGSLSLDVAAGFVAESLQQQGETPTLRISVARPAQFSLIYDNAPTGTKATVVPIPLAMHENLMVVDSNGLTVGLCADTTNQAELRCPILVDTSPITGTDASPYLFSAAYPDPAADLPVLTLRGMVSGGAGDYRFTKDGSNGLMLNAGDATNPNYGVISIPQASLIVGQKLGITVKINDGGATPAAGYAGQTPELTYTLYVRVVALAAEIGLDFVAAASASFSGGKVVVTAEAVPNALGQMRGQAPSHVPNSGNTIAFTFAKTGGHPRLNLAADGQLSFTDPKPTAETDYTVQYRITSPHSSLTPTEGTLTVQIIPGALRLAVEHNPNYAGGAPASFTKNTLTQGATPGVSAYEIVFSAPRQRNMPNPTTLLNKLIPLPGLFRPAGPVYPEGTQPGVASGGRDSGVVAAGTRQDLTITNAIARIYAEGGTSVTLTHVGTAPTSPTPRLVLHSNGLIAIANVNSSPNANKNVDLMLTVQAMATPATGDPLLATVTLSVQIVQTDLGNHDIGWAEGFAPDGETERTLFFTGAHAYVVRDGANPATSTLALSGKSRAYIAQITVDKGTGLFYRNNGGSDKTLQIDDDLRVYMPGNLFGNVITVSSVVEDTFEIRDTRNFGASDTLSVTLKIAAAEAVRPEIRTGLGGQGLSEQNPLELLLNEDDIRLPSQEVATVRLVNQTFSTARDCSNSDLSREVREEDRESGTRTTICIRFATVRIAAAAAGDTPDFANPFNSLRVDNNGVVSFINNNPALEGRSSSDRALHSVVIMLTPTGGSAIPLTLWARVSRPQAVVNVREGRLNLNIPPAGLPEATLALMTDVDNTVPATPVTLAQNGAVITYPPLGANPFAPTHNAMFGGQPIGNIAVCDRVTDVCSRDLAGLAVEASDDFTVSDGKLRLPQNIGSKLTSDDVKITLKMTVTYAGGKSAESRFTVNFLSQDFFGAEVDTFYEEATKVIRNPRWSSSADENVVGTEFISLPVINLPANDSADVVVSPSGERRAKTDIGITLTLQTGGNEYLKAPLTVARVSCVGGTGNCTGVIEESNSEFEIKMDGQHALVLLKANARLHYNRRTGYTIPIGAPGSKVPFQTFANGFHPATVKLTRGSDEATTVLFFQIRADSAESVPVAVPGTSYMTFGEYAAATSQNSLTLILANVRIAHSSIADSRGDEQAAYSIETNGCTATGTNAPDWCDQIAVAESGAVVFTGSPDNVAVESRIGVATLLVQGKPEERVVFAEGPIGEERLLITPQGSQALEPQIIEAKATMASRGYYNYFNPVNRIVVGNTAYHYITAFVQQHGKDVTVTHSAQPQLVTIQDGLKIGLGGVLRIGSSVRTEPFGAELKIRVSRNVGYAADGTQSVHLSTATMLVSVVPTPLNPGADNVAEAQARPALPLEVESDLVGDGSRSNPFIFEIGGFQTAMTEAADTATPQPYNYYARLFRTITIDGVMATVRVGRNAERAHREELIAAIAPAGSGHPYLDPKQWHVDMYQANARQPGSRASYTDGALGLELELQNKVTLGSGLPARAEIRFNHVNAPNGAQLLTAAYKAIGENGQVHEAKILFYRAADGTLVRGVPQPPRIGMHTIVIAARARHISEYSLIDGEGKLKDRGVVGETRNCNFPPGSSTRACTFIEHAAQRPSGYKAGTRVEGHAVFYTGIRTPSGRPGHNNPGPDWQKHSPFVANEAYIYRAGSRIQMLTLYVNVREAPQNAAIQMLNRRSGQLNDHPAVAGIYAMATVEPEGSDGVLVKHPVPVAPATVNYDQLLGGLPLAEFTVANAAPGGVEWEVNAPFFMRGGTLYTSPRGFGQEVVIPPEPFPNGDRDRILLTRHYAPDSFVGGGFRPENTKFVSRPITLYYGGWDEVVSKTREWVPNACAASESACLPSKPPQFKGKAVRFYSDRHDLMTTPTPPRVMLTARISAPRYGLTREFRVIFAKEPPPGGG